VRRAVRLVPGLSHRSSIRYPDHKRRLREFIHEFGLEESLSSPTTEWCSSSIAHVRLNGTGLRFWADSCSLTIKMQVFGLGGFLLSGVRIFDLTKTEEETIRREIERIIKKALPEPTKRPRKRT